MILTTINQILILGAQSPIAYIITILALAASLKLVWETLHFTHAFVRSMSFTYCLLVSAYQKARVQGTPFTTPGIGWFYKMISKTTWRQYRSHAAIEVISVDFKWVDTFTFTTYKDL